MLHKLYRYSANNAAPISIKTRVITNEFEARLLQGNSSFYHYARTKIAAINAIRM